MLQKTTFNQGEIIAGTVVMNMTQAFPAKVLQLEVKGTERSSIELDARNKQVHTNLHQAKKTLFTFKTALIKFPEGGVQPGGYQFPF